MSIFRFGVAGPGNIARKFADSLSVIPNAVLGGAASNSKERAIAFVDEYSDQYPEAVVYDSYTDMANDPRIDAVYVSNLHTQHANTAILFLSHGKPVLCEKPFALNGRETDQMIASARDNNTFLMEAMWTRFMPVTLQVKKWIDSGIIGMPVRAITDFGMELMTGVDKRILAIEKGGGALLDLGIYPISYFHMIFGMAPEETVSTVTKAVTGVDSSFEGIFRYGKNPGRFAKDYGTAVAAVSIDKKMTQSMKIIGTKGHIIVSDFWVGKAAELYVSKTVSDYPKEPTEVFAPEYISTGYQYEATEVIQCVQSNQKESSRMTLSETRENMRTMDTIRKQWNLVYPQEI